MAAVSVSEGKASTRAAMTTSLRDWVATGDDVDEYAIEPDRTVKHGGRASGSVRALVSTPKGFVALAQWSSPRPYAGKRVRLSAFVKTENVVGSAGLWMRLDGGGARQAFDNMNDRPLQGTHDWTRYEIVLDVAPN